jgi:alpha-tubulin suppressor-like RCC1 family protein/superfamily II DNA or RNA helicase
MKMRSYQVEAMNFFTDLHSNNISGGILADEMGLGKTLQTISILANLKETRQTKGVHLIIAPLSLLGQWMSELKRWCPSLVARKFHGDSRAACEQTIKAAIKLDDPTSALDVIVTSYEICTKEKSLLKKMKLDLLVVDEAHRLKNEASQLSQTLRMFNSNFRLLLTGTPLQNNLHELWALLNFVFPTLFKESTAFDSLFDIKAGVAETKEISMLHDLLAPFMLRRLKADVEKRLQPKTETKLFVGLSQMQSKLYKAILERDAKEFMLAGEGSIRSKKAGTLLKNIVLQLRKVCNHPYLFDKMEPGPPFVDGPHLWQNSGKMVVLDKLLTKLKANKSRVLIFSQMTRMLDIISDYCHYKGHTTCRIDGKVSVEHREAALRDYTRPGSDKFIFLLSTRAGGLGLNLAVADSVVLYDSDWNPHADLQAIDRAHRIGQKGKVHVYRFVTDRTVDELICERAEKKLYLDAMVMARGQMSNKHKDLNNDALLKMVKFGADAEFKSAGSTITDDDIDLIISRGQHKTNITSEKLKSECKHDLQSFTMTATTTGSAYTKPSQDGANTAGVSVPAAAAAAAPPAFVAGLGGGTLGGQKDPGLEGRAKEVFEIIDRGKEIFAKVPWISPRGSGSATDTVEAKVQAFTYANSSHAASLLAGNSSRGLSTQGIGSMHAIQWKRLKEALLLLGFESSNAGLRTISVTSQVAADWSYIRQAVVLLQIAEGVEMNQLRSSKRTASNDDADGVSSVAVEGVGQSKTGVGNYCYVWGLVDWTDPNSSKAIRLDRPTPIYMAPSIQIAQIACGLRHSVAVSKDGKAYTMGHGAREALGRSQPYTYSLTPLVIVQNGFARHFVQAACGEYHSLLLSSAGEVWSWGAASDAQLGRSVPEPARPVDQVAGPGRRPKDKWGARPGQVSGSLRGSRVVFIACGPTCSYAVDDVGRVFSWGSSVDGMLGIAEHGEANRKIQANRVEKPELIIALSSQNIVKVVAGHQHMVALDACGHVYACGFGGYGRLGMKDTRNRFEPEIVQTLAHIQCKDIAAAAAHTLALSITDDVYWWGRDGMKTDGRRIPQAVQELSGIGVVKLAAGRGINFALTGTGQMWVWGQAFHKECYGLGGAAANLLHSPVLIPVLSNRKVVNIVASDTLTIAVVDPKSSSTDTCSACRDGGALLMCDTCPCAFHYNCLPQCIEPSELPEGDWSCNQCMALGARKRVKNSLGKSGCFDNLVELLDYANPTAFSPSFELGTYGGTPADMQYESDRAKVDVLAQKGFFERRREITTFRQNLEVEGWQEERIKKRQMMQQNQMAAKQLKRFQDEQVQSLQSRQRNQWEVMSQYHQMQGRGTSLLQQQATLFHQFEMHNREMAELREKLATPTHFGLPGEKVSDPLASNGEVSVEKGMNSGVFPFYQREGEEPDANALQYALTECKDADSTLRFASERDAVLRKAQMKERETLTTMQTQAQNDIRMMSKEELMEMVKALELSMPGQMKAQQQQQQQQRGQQRPQHTYQQQHQLQQQHHAPHPSSSGQPRTGGTATTPIIIDVDDAPAQQVPTMVASSPSPTTSNATSEKRPAPPGNEGIVVTSPGKRARSEPSAVALAAAPAVAGPAVAGYVPISNA